MATMFGADATALQGPQGAGTAPINPVQGVPFQNPLEGVLGAAGNLLQMYGKKKETPGWHALIDQYSGQFSQLNQQTVTATDSASRILAANKTRQLYNDTVAAGSAMGAGPDFYKALSAVRGAHMEGTGAQEGEDVRKKELEREEQGINDMIKEGMLPSGMTSSNIPPELRNSAVQLRNTQNEIARLAEESEKRIQREREMLKDGQANNIYRQQQLDWEQSQQAEQAQGSLISAGMNVLGDSFAALQSRILPDGSNYAEVSNEFSRMAALYKGQAGVLLQKNPAAYANFNGLMDETSKLMIAALDPKNQAADRKAQIENLVSAAKYNLLANDNKLTKLVGFSSMLGHSIGGTIGSHNVSMKFMNEHLLEAHTKGVNTAVTTGDVPTQRAMFGQIESRLAGVNSLPPEFQQKVIDDAFTQYNATLNAIDTIDPKKPASLSYAIEHIANTGKAFIDRGLYDADAAKKAIPALERTYLNGLSVTVKNALDTPVGERTYENGQPSANLTPTLMNTIKFTMQDDGTIRAEQSRDPRMKFVASDAHVASRVREAQSIADELTRTVKAAAHLTNNTNYKQFWEDHRHRLVKGFYPTPKEGEFLKSKGWDGVGFINNEASYDKSKGGLSELAGQDTN